MLVFDPALPAAPIAAIPILGEEPRALAKSADGSEVYVAVFESGNGSTILGGGLDTSMTLALRNVVSDPTGPYGGQNPPPNAGTSFEPPLAPGNPPPPRVGLIVKKDAQGRWMDDNGGNWTDLVSGANSFRSDRPVGWDVTDHDVGIIDTGTFAVTYADRLMNINMALAVHPTSGDVTVVGTDGTNEIRFEPNLNGVFLRVVMGVVSGSSTAVRDLNPHLDYSTENVPQSTRDLSLGDPRGIACSADRTRAFVTGMGSNNVAVFDTSGARVGVPIEVGEGPTGIVLDDAGGRAFVVNKFEAAISVIDLAVLGETARVAFHDPSSEAIRIGRRHLYSTHETSGLGHVSCASCHVDARNDRLAWDLGDPSGAMISDNDQNLGMGIPGLNLGFQDFHPMKGPMRTQTFQDIIGHEPLHWRGDRDGLMEFSPAFVGLQGDDAEPSFAEMLEFSDFLATVAYPPNPYRNLDNSLPTDLPLPGHFSSGRFSPAGTPLPNGNAASGLSRYIPPFTLDAQFACVTCHTLPTGMGADMRFQVNQYVPFPEGPNGEKHHALVAVDGSTNRNIKIAQLRNVYENVGMDFTQTSVPSGFGFLHDGSIPSLVHFLSAPAFEFTGDQALANMVAFMLAFAGSDLPNGNTGTILFPPGLAGLDTHAGVGEQVTVVDFAGASVEDQATIATMQSEADLGRVGLVIRGRLVNGPGQTAPRGAVYLGAGAVQLDRGPETTTLAALLGAASAQDPMTLTLVPAGSELRIGIDRDLDGFLDRDELDAGSDPANRFSVPELGTNYCGPAVVGAAAGPGVIAAVGSSRVSDNELRLVATSLPPNTAGYFVTSETQAFIPNPAGSLGNLCISGNVARFAQQIQTSGAGGRIEAQIDLTLFPTNPPQPVAAGQTWNFQAWFRDSSGGQPTTNFTDALAITFVAG